MMRGSGGQRINGLTMGRVVIKQVECVKCW